MNQSSTPELKLPHDVMNVPPYRWGGVEYFWLGAGIFCFVILAWFVIKLAKKLSSGNKKKTLSFEERVYQEVVGVQLSGDEGQRELESAYATWAGVLKEAMDFKKGTSLRVWNNSEIVKHKNVLDAPFGGQSAGYLEFFERCEKVVYQGEKPSFEQARADKIFVMDRLNELFSGQNTKDV